MRDPGLYSLIAPEDAQRGMLDMLEHEIEHLMDEEFSLLNPAGYSHTRDSGTSAHERNKGQRYE